MGAMVKTNAGSYRYDPNASGVSYANVGSTDFKAAKPGQAPGISLFDQSTGQFHLSTSPQGQALQATRKKTATDWAKNQQAADLAAVDTQETADRIAENKERNAQVNQLAFAQAGNPAQLGRGTFQRKQSGMAPNNAVAGLNAANAASLAATRKNQLKAEQKASPAYTDPSLGYAAQLAKLRQGLT